MTVTIAPIPSPTSATFSTRPVVFRESEETVRFPARQQAYRRLEAYQIQTVVGATGRLTKVKLIAESRRKTDAKILCELLWLDALPHPMHRRARGVDSGNHRVRVVDSAGKITTVAGREKGYSGDGGPASSAELNAPSALCFDARGSLYGNRSRPGE
jgi:hypothetical protein